MLKDKIWELIFDLTHEAYHDMIESRIKAAKEWQLEVGDIVGNIEDLASRIEDKIEEDHDNQEPDAHSEEKGHNMV